MLLSVNTNPPSKAEIIRALKILKDGKTPGPDDIQPEVLKADPITTTYMLHHLFLIWEQEKVPTECKNGYLVKLLKKRDLGMWKNWRGITRSSDREEVVAEVDTADREEVDVEVDTAGLEREVAVVDTADREEVVLGEVDTADRVEIIGEEDTVDREEIVAMFNGAVALGADRTFEEEDTADFGDIRMAGVGDVEAEVVAAGVTFSEESTGSSDDTRVVICVESSDTESTRVL